MPSTAVTKAAARGSSNIRPHGSTPVAGSTSLTERPSLPPLPAPLASVIAGGKASIFGSGGFTGSVERPGWRPAALTDDMRAETAAAIVEWREALAPGDPLLIMGRIHTLLAHWRDRDGLDEPTRDAINDDWMSVLHRYPLWAVHAAATQWLTMEQRWRPLPGNIRLLCDQAVTEDRLTLRLLERLAAAPSEAEPAG